MFLFKKMKNNFLIEFGFLIFGRKPKKRSKNTKNSQKIDKNE